MWVFFIFVLCPVLNGVLVGPCCLSVKFVVMRVVFLSSFCVLCSMVCYVSKWGPCCFFLFVVMCVGVFFIFVLCPVLNGVLC